MNISDHVDATSASSHTTSSGLKGKAIEDFKILWVITIYLTLMLGAFLWYRRLVLSESGINYFHYGAAFIQALILAKVVMIGQALGLGRQFEGSRLIWSVLFKSLVFGVFIMLFGVLEHLIEGLLHRDTWDQIEHSLVRASRTEILARIVIGFATSIPFFAFWEADRVMGGHKLFNLFFRKRAA